MSEPRLATAIEVSALLARARDAGGFGTVLRRGDSERGSLAILLVERGTPRLVLERLLQKDGRYDWEARDCSDSVVLERRLAQAQDRDPDLWLIELDVPSAERFVAEMS